MKNLAINQLSFSKSTISELNTETLETVNSGANNFETTIVIICTLPPTTFPGTCFPGPTTNVSF